MKILESHTAKFCYQITEGSIKLGEVFVLDPKHITVTCQLKGLKCVRK